MSPHPAGRKPARSRRRRRWLPVREPSGEGGKREKASAGGYWPQLIAKIAKVARFMAGFMPETAFSVKPLIEQDAQACSLLQCSERKAPMSCAGFADKGLSR
jgi:hypothetical protein